MNLKAVIVAAALGAAVTGLGWMASVRGMGLEGRLEKPVSIRKGSRPGRHRYYGYFTGRRHWRGGFRGGK
ncbi:MAG: hypothetical protein D6806_18920 [Deltaproteobacteria bacterium]|nr:MAG: hypothetical protein D6806_18920 [Deltaproteobacteria bacterium]